MEIVRILPHHALHYFEVYYLSLEPNNALSWYDNERMESNGIRAIELVVSNPSQLVQIVNTHDETCRMCPFNQHGDNYVSPERICTTYDSGTSDKDFAEILGLEGVLDGEPITSEEFFALMRLTYERLLNEDDNKSTSEDISLNYIFRRRRDKMMELKLGKYLPPLGSNIFLTLMTDKK